MRRLLFALATALLLPAGVGAQPANLAEIARTLPPLPRDAGAVRLPLGTEGAIAWRPVRDGISVTAAPEGLTASYRVATGQPAGAALVIPPGALAGIRSLRLKLHGTRNVQLMVFLRDAAGVAYAFPSVPVRVGDTRETEIFVSDLSYLGQASSVPDPGSFDLAGAVMISLVDIAGFMGSETPETAWTLESLEGVLQ
jgi:hypothetical protein